MTGLSLMAYGLAVWLALTYLHKCRPHFICKEIPLRPLCALLLCWWCPRYDVKRINHHIRQAKAKVACTAQEWVVSARATILLSTHHSRAIHRRQGSRHRKENGNISHTVIQDECFSSLTDYIPFRIPGTRRDQQLLHHYCATTSQVLS